MYNTGYEKLFTNPKASPFRFEYDCIHRDTIFEWSCPPHVCQQLTHTFFPFNESNTFICLISVKKILIYQLNFSAFVLRVLQFLEDIIPQGIKI